MQAVPAPGQVIHNSTFIYAAEELFEELKPSPKRPCDESTCYVGETPEILGVENRVALTTHRGSYLPVGNRVDPFANRPSRLIPCTIKNRCEPIDLAIARIHSIVPRLQIFICLGSSYTILHPSTSKRQVVPGLASITTLMYLGHHAWRLGWNGCLLTLAETRHTTWSVASSHLLSY